MEFQVSKLCKYTHIHLYDGICWYCLLLLWYWKIWLLIRDVSSNDLCGTIPTSGPFEHIPLNKYVSSFCNLLLASLLVVILFKLMYMDLIIHLCTHLLLLLNLFFCPWIAIYVIEVLVSFFVDRNRLYLSFLFYVILWKNSFFSHIRFYCHLSGWQRVGFDLLLAVWNSISKFIVSVPESCYFTGLGLLCLWGFHKMKFI